MISSRVVSCVVENRHAISSYGCCGRGNSMRYVVYRYSFTCECGSCTRTELQLVQGLDRRVVRCVAICKRCANSRQSDKERQAVNVAYNTYVYAPRLLERFVLLSDKKKTTTVHVVGACAINKRAIQQPTDLPLSILHTDASLDTIPNSVPLCRGRIIRATT